MALLPKTQPDYRTFIGIREGKILFNTDDDRKGQEIGTVTGTLMSITPYLLKKVNAKYYAFNIDDGADKYRVSVAENIAKGMIFSLASVENFAKNSIEIEAKPKDIYTNVTIKCNGVQLAWLIPHDQWPKGDALSRKVDELVDLINSRLRGCAQAPETIPAVPAQAPMPSAPVPPTAPQFAASPKSSAAAPAAFSDEDPFPDCNEFDDAPEEI